MLGKRKLPEPAQGGVGGLLVLIKNRCIFLTRPSGDGHLCFQTAVKLAGSICLQPAEVNHGNEQKIGISRTR